MALIKDKYRKSPKTRSRYLVNREATVNPSVTSMYKTTEQKLSDNATARRESVNVEDKIENVRNIIGRELAVINTVENVFTLSPGSSLKDLIISHYDGSGTSSVISLYWSNSPRTDLTFTVSTGVITDVTGGAVYRLFTDTFTSQSTLSLANSGLFNTFENINKTIYFYAVCSVLGPTLTIVKSNEKTS